MALRFKKQKNRDFFIDLREGGTEAVRIEKESSTLNAAAQSEKVYMYADGTAGDGLGTYRSYYIENDAGTATEMARIEVATTDVSDGSEDSFFKFYTMNAGTLANRLTIDTGGSLSGVGDITFSADQDVDLLDNHATAWDIGINGGVRHLVFTTTNSGEKVTFGCAVHMANTMDIIPDTAGGSDLGGTSNEWGNVYISDNVGLYGGADQDWSILHDNDAGMQINIAANDATALEIQQGTVEFIVVDTTTGSEVLTVGCSTADEAAQNTTLQAGNDVVIKCGTAASDTVKLQAYDVDGTAYVDMITLTGDATDPTMALAATGGITISNAVTMSDNFTIANTKDILCATAAGSDLGSSTTEWGSIYMGDSTALKIGAGDDITFTHDGTTGLDMVVTTNDSGAFTIKDSAGSPVSFLTIDTTTATPRVSIEQTVKVANTMDILPATAGGSDLGSTSAEWGSVIISDSKGFYAGAGQDWSIVHDGTLGCDFSVAANDSGAFVLKAGTVEYVIVDTTTGSEVLTVGATTADEAAQNTTLQAGNDVVVKCGTAASDTVKLQAYDVDGTAYVDMITLTGHATDPTMTLAASGGITISNAVTVANTMDIIAATSGGSDLGSTAGEWGTCYLGDSKGVQFGADQDATLVHDGTSGLDLSVADNDSGAFVIKEATNAYITVNTTDDAERITAGKIVAQTATAVDMANAKHTLVLGTAGANETKLTGNIVVCDPNGGAQDLVLPAEASSTGVVIFFTNSANAAETVTIKDDAEGYTVIAVDQNQNGVIWCDGTTWYGCVASET